MNNLWQDLRYGLRMLLKSPGFTAVVVLTLALGISVNTMIFSGVNAVLLRPLPYDDSDRNVYVWATNRQQGWDRISASIPDFVDWRDQNKVFEALAAFFHRNYHLIGGDEPQRVLSYHISASLFPILGVKPVLGRAFLPAEDQPASERVAILRHGLWQRRFGGDPSLIGQTITLDGESFTVIGIMAPDFWFPTKDVELWVPLRVNAMQLPRDRRFVSMIGRLKSGVRAEQAAAEMEAITRRLEREYPQSNTGWSANVVPMYKERLGPRARLALPILWVAVGFVLLIACANVANLLLARTATRQKEIAVRAALGASRHRLIRQLLTESLLLAVLGGAVGLLLTRWGADVVLALVPDYILGVDKISWEVIDARVLGFTLTISLLTAIVFGLAPALEASNPDLNESLKEGGRRTSGGARGRLTGHLLVVSEVALSLVLLTGAGLTIKAFLHLQRVDPGFNPEILLTLRVDLPTYKYPEGHQREAFYRQVLERIRINPEVQAVGAINALPLSGESHTSNFTIEGRPAVAPSDRPWGVHSTISPDYFRLMDIPLLKGRYFTDQDTAESALVAIIGEQTAYRYWPGEDPIGGRIRLEDPDISTGEGRWLTVVGLVRDVRNRGVDQEPLPELYVPHAQSPTGTMTLVVRTASEPVTLAAAVQSEIWAVDKEQPVYDIMSMERLLSDQIGGIRVFIWLLGIFAVAALVLAAVGIYGVMSYAVSQRTHEIGVRMALGAQPSDVLRLVMRQGFAVTIVSVIIGLAGAWALTRLMTGLLFGVSPTDPATYSGITLLLAVVALLACYLPARRAAKVDPMVALRYE